MKIPLNPPISKGENRYPPLEKGGKGGFHQSVGWTPPQNTLPFKGRGRKRIEDTLLKQGVLKRLVREYSFPDINLTEDSFIIV